MDHRSPFLDDLDYSAVRQLVEDQGLVLKSRWPQGLDEVETEESAKYGPLSPVLPYGEWDANVEEYFLPHKGETVSPEALKAVIDLFRGIKLQPVPLEFAFERMPTNTNLGLPWWTRNREFRRDYAKRARTMIKQGFKQGSLPAVLALRKQGDGSYWGKHRPVWAMDHLETILGLMIQLAILPVARQIREFAAWNTLDVIDQTVSDVLEEQGDKPTLSSDFGGYDRRLSAPLISQGFLVLHAIFGPTATGLIEWLEQNMLEVGLLTPTGLRQGRDGGMPSGSALTNLIDSICQLLLFHEAAIRLNVEPGPVTVMGDDGLWTFSQMPPLDEIASVMDEFGMEANPDKQFLSVGKARYLQRFYTLTWMPDGLARGIRSGHRTFASAITHERSPDPAVWTKEMHSLRWLAQFENLKWHPNFKEFAKILKTNDKLSSVPVSELLSEVGGTEAVKSALKRPSFPFGVEDLSGIRNFSIVKELAAVAA